MRIKWAIVFNVYQYDPKQPYYRDLEIYPYVKGNRKFVDQRIYSHNGLPIPPELQDIIEVFLQFLLHPSQLCMELPLCHHQEDRQYRIHYT